MKKTFDAIVVGAGSVGNPTALALAQRGLKVLALDRRTAPGMGENKAAIGGVRATHSDPAKIQTSILSLEIVSTWEERYGRSVGWKTGGYCYPVYDTPLRDQLQGFLPLQKRSGLEIDWVSREEICEIVPGINPEGLLGGTFSPKDGQVSPLKMAAEVQREAQRLGVQYLLGERVCAYEIRGGTIQGVTTERGSYAAPIVVVSTGSDAAAHGELLGVPLPVLPDSHEAGITAPIEPFLGPLVVDMRPGLEGRTANFYFGQGEGGQIIFCYTPSTLFPGQNRENLSEFMPTLAYRLISLIPRLKNLLVRRIWRGCYPMTPDGVPIVDALREIEGVYVAVGMCGQGFMLGPGTGENLAEKIVNGSWILADKIQSTFSLYRDFGTQGEALG